MDEIASGRVHDALGLAGGTGGVEKEQHVFAVHGFAITLIRLIRHEIGPEMVPIGLHVDRVVTSAKNNRLLDMGCHLESFIDIRLQRNDRSLASRRRHR